MTNKPSKKLHCHIVFTFANRNRLPDAFHRRLCELIGGADIGYYGWARGPEANDHQPWDGCREHQILSVPSFILLRINMWLNHIRLLMH
jgi:hypothetical protein